MVKIHAPFRVFVAARRQVDFERGHVGWVKTQINSLQCNEALDENAGADQQHERQRYLRHHQNAARAIGTFPAGVST